MHQKFFTGFLFPVFIVCAFYYQFPVLPSTYHTYVTFILNILQLKYYKSRFKYEIRNQESYLK